MSLKLDYYKNCYTIQVSVAQSDKDRSDIEEIDIRATYTI